MDVKIAVENTAVDTLTEHFALVSDTNAALLQELSQHAMFTEALPDVSVIPEKIRVKLTRTLRPFIEIMVFSLEQLNVGEDGVKARESWNRVINTSVIKYCTHNLRFSPMCWSTIFVSESSGKTWRDSQLDNATAFKVTPLLNFIETSISKYLENDTQIPKLGKGNQIPKDEYSNLDTLLTILHTHLDGMSLRIWSMFSIIDLESWHSKIAAHLEDCVEVIQYNDTNEPHIDNKAGTFIADGRVIEELPVTIEAQSLLRDACEWWCSKLSECTMSHEPHPKLVEFHSKRDELSLLKLTELYCAIQEYNEEWAFSLLL